MGKKRFTFPKMCKTLNLFDFSEGHPGAYGIDAYLDKTWNHEILRYSFFSPRPLTVDDNKTNLMLYGMVVV